ncbi:MAG: DNA translocase FtsK [Synergistaceae bacterium]|jgi:S-DNA-T family DNA segregation ATPase FtsK/SpoIIIE|nr:DNA translocase FtsK [Synergistaceae bacterium]
MASSRNKRTRGSGGEGGGIKLLVLLFMGGIIYLAGALMDVSWIGARGKVLGQDLRSVWGGALFIPILFMLYLCSAWLRRRRIPRPMGQILGTLQLYISAAFILGLFRRAGGGISWVISEPGRVGSVLADFFFLNLGGVGALLVAAASLVLAAILFGVKLPLFHGEPAELTRPTRGSAEKSAGERKGRLGRVLTTINNVTPYVDDSVPYVPPRSKPDLPWNPPQSDDPLRAERFISPSSEVPEAESRSFSQDSAISGAEALSSEKGFQIVRETLGELMASLKAESLTQPDPVPIHPERDTLVRDEPPVKGNVERAVPPTPEERVRELKNLLAFPPSSLGSEVNSAGMRSANNEEQRGPRLEFPPPLDVFGPPAESGGQDDDYELANAQAGTIVETLQNFGVKADVAHIVVGPSVIQFQVELAPGVKVSKVSGLANDLTMALAVVSVRVEAPILGQKYVGVEIPNVKRKGIPLRSVMESEEFQKSGCVLPLPMGVRVDSQHLVCGLEDMPHLLVAGTTGSGKSVFMNTCVLGMCSRRSPEELRLILVDPKHVEFAVYEGLPHLFARPISDPKSAVSALAWVAREMETRSEAFAKVKVRSLASYNEKALPKDRFPHIVVVVDELADLMYTAGKEVEGLIARLAQKARAAGIHLILATQRPSVDVVTGLIKANIPARVAFALPSQTDSRTIIDTGGAEKLLGKGDMLFYSTRYPRPIRLQASFITEDRTLEFVEYMKNAFGTPNYIEFGIEEE